MRPQFKNHDTCAHLVSISSVVSWDQISLNSPYCRRFAAFVLALSHDLIKVRPILHAISLLMTAAYPSKNGSPAAGFCTAEVAALLDFQKRSIGLYGLYFDTDDENDLMASSPSRLSFLHSGKMSYRWLKHGDYFHGMGWFPNGSRLEAMKRRSLHFSGEKAVCSVLKKGFNPQKIF